MWLREGIGGWALGGRRGALRGNKNLLGFAFEGQVPHKVVALPITTVEKDSFSFNSLNPAT